MFFDSAGIILRKSRLSRYKIIVLDKIQGKIECISTDLSFSTGALITYTVRAQGSIYFISNSSSLYTPLSLAGSDMLFFHHVLELIYYFTNIGNCSEDVFGLLAFLYSNEQDIITAQSKKIFLLKLLTSMGSIPENNDARTNSIARLTTLSIKQLNSIAISTKDEQELDRWLWCCVKEHPYVNEFKTIHFLAENRIL